MKNKQTSFRGPWLAVTIGIAGLVVGYSFVVANHGEEAFAGMYQCPMHKQICKSGDCDKNPSCASGACSKDCPGNCGHTV
ncbi:MAG TPA: hypothetical protein VHA78_01240 [Candidatus Peribacteraceae bacterium]|nr:hypothetical protein [Candidatus Peribacteraceae bacterium]